MRERRAQLERGSHQPSSTRIRRSERPVAQDGRYGVRLRRAVEALASDAQRARGRSSARARGRACARSGPRLGHAGRDQPRARGDVVPGEHPVVDAEHHVGQREVVVARRRQTLERQPPVVGEVAGGAALKRRQPGDRCRRGAARAAARTRRPSALARSPCAARIDVDRIGGEKRVAAEPCRAGARCRGTGDTAAREPLAAPHRIRQPATAPRRAASRGLQPSARSPIPTRAAGRCVSRTCSDFASSGGVR